MLKGFIVLFTGIISYLFFKKQFTKWQIFGALVTALGLTLVGSSNLDHYNSKCIIKSINIFILVAPNPILGNFLVLLSQVFLSGMFVFEEKILKEYDVFNILNLLIFFILKHTNLNILT